MMTNVDFWKLLAGLGLFLFAMLQMEESITTLAGRSFKLFLRNNTNHPIKGLLSGVLLTALLQSSSALSLLLLAFVGAGILSMKRALPVIYGSNLGTTITGWLLVTLGFNLHIEAIALPLVGVGGMLLFFFNNVSNYFNIGRFVLSFGLVFLGLEYMKVSMEMLAQTLNLTQFTQDGPMVFFVVGIVITALIQSSLVTLVIALSALHTNMLTLSTAAAIVIGANVGTTVTVFLGSLGGIPAKKQVAFAHFLFNLITAGIAFSLLSWMLALITEVLGLQDPLLTLVSFHTLFNLMGVLLFLPFTKPLAQGLEKLFSPKKITINHYIHLVTVQVPEAAIEALQKEAHRLLTMSLLLNLKAFRLNHEKLNRFLMKTENSQTSTINRLSYEKGYQLIKHLEGEMLLYYAEIQKQRLESRETEKLNRLMQVIQNIIHAVKGLKDIEHNLLDFEGRTKPSYQQLLLRFKDTTQKYYGALVDLFFDDSKKISFEELSALMVMIQQNYEQLLSDIYQTITKSSLDEVSLSTFFIVNRELYSSHKAILLALSDLYGFPSEHSAYLSTPLTPAVS
ncbi:Na/Pi cotransporter family protein [Catalinimonas niigatensis]|uniref:Na/Pi cotransporter family protein n=1 Tax=Catalinimonas niigatensis TaxID=1397264 RepID=UPI002666927D|nr:Na/Pi symporter [Catalinimonas niigatensis]WPP49789.1 Na/Pi symporter [Catalinimonas niigatensis]